MNYKLIACDLDETLLDDHHVIPQNNIDAIQKARKEYGVKFVPATGRGFMSLQHTLKELGLNEQMDEYVLSFNGGAITENKSNRLVRFHGLPFTKMAEIFAYGLDKDVCIQIYTKDMIYVFHLSQSENERLKKQDVVCKIMDHDAIDFLKDESIAKILFQNTDVPYLMGLEPGIKSITDGYCSISYSSNRYMEFNAIGVDKGQGVRDLAELLNIPIEEVIAIGDNYNDLPMLQVAGLSVAAANSVDAVKQACHITTKADNNQGVVAEVIERFIFKKPSV